MKGEVEHANLNVRDLDETITFLTTALPNFKVRYRGEDTNGTPWCHIGTDSTYLALGQGFPDDGSREARLNHVGFVVDNADELKKRCLDGGFKEGYVENKIHPHRKRVYIKDEEGVEWEFVEYLSDDPAKRHDYSDA
jgi:catechol 2,3-dioxygenase-like lactoylglutathione lyase family enzyme